MSVSIRQIHPAFVGEVAGIDLRETVDPEDVAAIEEGIVPGGGTALLRASSVLDDIRAKGDRRFGIEILHRACAAPLTQIANNAGEEGAVIADETLSRKASEGFNAVSSEWVDLVQAGILDPTKVVRLALQNAASIAGLMLTTDTLVTSVKDDEEAVDGAIS